MQYKSRRFLLTSTTSLINLKRYFSLFLHLMQKRLFLKKNFTAKRCLIAQSRWHRNFCLKELNFSSSYSSANKWCCLLLSNKKESFSLIFVVEISTCVFRLKSGYEFVLKEVKNAFQGIFVLQSNKITNIKNVV